jgi:hypothetical protein
MRGKIRDDHGNWACGRIVSEHHITVTLQDLNACLKGRLPLVRRHVFHGGVQSTLHELPQTWHRSQARTHLEPLSKATRIAAQESARDFVVLRMPSIRDSDGAACQFWRDAA